MLERKTLSELLHYDHETGVFTRRRNGKLAGSIRPDGYIHINVGGKLYFAHRLAFLYMSGVMPEDCVDHLDGCRSNNRFCNLRMASHRTNNENRRHSNKNNQSGLLGSYWDKQAGKWKAGITVGGRFKHLGFCSSPEEAHQIYLTAKRQMHAGGLL